MDCFYCHEPIEGQFHKIPHTDAVGKVEAKAWHPECFLRDIIGGVNHLRHLCSCYGGTEPPDPPGMSTRQAAIAAAEYFRSTTQNLSQQDLTLSCECYEQKNH